MKKSFIAAVVGTAVCLAPMLAWAASTATTNTPVNDPNRVVCKEGAAPIGSRIPAARVCHTQHEWDQITQDAQHAVDDFDRRGGQANMPGGGG